MSKMFGLITISSGFLTRWKFIQYISHVNNMTAIRLDKLTKVEIYFEV